MNWSETISKNISHENFRTNSYIQNALWTSEKDIFKENHTYAHNGMAS